MASYRTVLLTGLPRAGTRCAATSSTAVRAYWRCTNRSHRMTSRRSSRARRLSGIIGGFVARTRASVQTSGLALSRHKNGAVPENPVSLEAGNSGLRNLDVTHG